MFCYNCGCHLSEHDFCTSCGADVSLYKKIMCMSNRFYNDGLEKAGVRDLTGAINSLRQSLKFNKNNIEARNLLGLVYFETGEVVAALSEWVISKNMRPEKNIADDYINMLQSNATRLDAINQTIKKYNQALVYCNQDSKDLAIIQLKKVLSLNPKFIVCDEPVSALDVSIQAQVVNLLRDYQQAEGTSYLFIAHDLSMVRYVSDDIGVMYLGQLVESSDSEEIYKNPLHPYTKGLLSCIPIADPKLARAHASAGVEGDLPSPVNPKPGCRFCGRCPYAKPICSEQTPAMKEAAPGHFVACHLY